MEKILRFSIYLISFSGLISSRLAAQTPVVNRGDVPSLEISNVLDIYLDETNQLTIADVSTPSFKGFKRNSVLFPSFGNFSGTAWLHFVVENTEDREVQHELLLNANVLDAKLYFSDNQQKTVELKAGRIYTGGTESFPNMMPRFVVSLKPSQKIHYYMSIKNHFVYSVKLTINSEEGFYQNQRVSHYFAGFYIGIMLIMILFNLFIYTSTRDSAYLWYVLTVLAVHIGVIGQLVTNGEYFGVKSPLLPSTEMWVAKCLGLASLIQFTRVFLHTAQSPKYDLFLKLNIILSGIFLIVGFFFPIAKVNVPSNIFVLVTLISFIVYSGLLFSRGLGYARYYFIAWLPLLLGMFVVISLNMTKNAHLLPNVNYLMCIAACAEVLLLSMALADKFNSMRQAKEKAELEHKGAILAMNRSLEATVKEKTRDIQSMLDNLKLGIFTVNHNLVVSQQHSQYLSTMVSSPSIESKLLSNILFEDAELGADVRNQVEAAIGASTEIDDIGFDGNAHLLIRQIRKKKDQHLREIEVDWSPIQNDEGIVEKLLVCMKDVTEFNQLKKEGEAQKRRMEILSQYLSSDRAQITKLEEHLLTLAEDARLIKHADVLIWSEVDRSNYIAQLFADLHTDKACSRRLKLTYLSDAVHQGEHYLQGVKRGSEAMSIEKIHSLLDHIAAIINEYRQTISSLGLDLKGGLSHHKAHNFESLVVDVLSERISLATQLGKPVPQVKLNINESIPLNAELEQTLEGLLNHLLRNSVDHGIEGPNERRAVKKLAQGLITLTVKKTDENYILEYQDDGQGLDLDRIYEKAVEKGLIAASTPLKNEEVAELIFASGFSTKDNVTEISGRGVGLDAVRRQARSINGSIAIQLVENLGHGTRGRWSFAFCCTWPCAPEVLLKTGS